MTDKAKNLLNDSESSQHLDNENNVNTMPQKEENKNRLRKTIIKFASLAVFTAIVIVFGALGWFAVNKITSGNGMNLRASYNGFELQVSGTNIGYDELYSFADRTGNYRDYTSKQTGIDAGQQTIRWRIAGTDDTLKPGSQGTLDFKVISTGADISSLNYSLNIISYTADTSTVEYNIGGDTSRVEYVTNLHEVDPTTASADITAGDAYLNSHIMFFKGRRTINASRNEYQYYDLITSVNNFTLTPDENGDVTIYWIWPNTFGQIALDSDNNSGANNDAGYLGAGVISVLDKTNNEHYSSDRSAVTTYLKTKTIFKGSDSYSDLIDTLYTNRTAGTSYSTQYEKLSAGYNAADQTIGNNIDYVLVILNANI